MTKFVAAKRRLGWFAAAPAACKGDAPEGASTAGSGGSATGGSADLGGGGSGGANRAGGSAGAGGIACDAPLAACGGACIDLRADPTHGGACGRSCLGAACVAGARSPEALTSVGKVALYALADDGTYVCWASPAYKAGAHSAMRRAPKALLEGASGEAFPGTTIQTHSLAFAEGKL